MSTADASVNARRTAPVLAALGDETRLALVARLNAGRSLSITQLTDGLGLTRQGVTKHLRVLEKAGIVRSNRVGRESRFCLEPAPVRDAQTYLDAVSAQWDDALGRLKDYLEN